MFTAALHNYMIDLRPHHRSWKRGAFWSILAALLLSGQAHPVQAQAAPPTPAYSAQIKVEYFGAERGTAGAAGDLVLLCVARNRGQATLADNALRLRCFAISGLEYATGNLTPTLPALLPGQAVSYRWHLLISGNRSPLVAAVALEAPGGGGNAALTLPVAPNTTPSGSGSALPPASVPSATLPSADAALATTSLIDPASRLVLAGIPRLLHSPRSDSHPDERDLMAHAGVSGETAFLSNNRVLLTVTASERRQPVFALSAPDGANWRTVSLLSGLAVRGGEDGQTPWDEQFRWHTTRVENRKEGAALTLIGTAGSRWHAELEIRAQPQTGALNATLRLTALRTMRCYGLLLPRLLCQTDEAPARTDGSPTLLPVAGEENSVLPDDTRLLARRVGSVTFGLAWPAQPVAPEWTFAPLRTGDAASPILQLSAQSAPAGDTILKGAGLKARFRWFAYAPSDTLRDALRFLMP